MKHTRNLKKEKTHTTEEEANEEAQAHKEENKKNQQTTRNENKRNTAGQRVHESKMILCWAEVRSLYFLFVCFFVCVYVCWCLCFCLLFHTRNN